MKRALTFCLGTVLALLLGGAVARWGAKKNISPTDCIPVRNQGPPTIRLLMSTDQDHAWVVNNIGDLWLTDDGGINWIKVSGDKFAGFMEVTFINSKTGWMLSDTGVVWGTQDGGRSWDAISELSGKKIKRYPCRELESESPILITFIDNSNGWAALREDEVDIIWRTKDGGNHWDKIGTLSIIDSNPVRISIEALFFRDSEVGWASVGGSESFIARTDDGGATWQRQSVDFTGSKQPRVGGKLNLGGIFNLYFSDENSGIASGNTRVFITKNGGKTWQESLAVHSDQTLYILSASFINQDEGWLAGASWQGSYEDIPVPIAKPPSESKFESALLHTADGGQTWQRVNVGITEHELFNIKFNDSVHGWVSSYNNVYRTDDGGLTWRMVLK